MRRLKIQDVFLQEGGFIKLSGNTKGELFLQFADALYRGGSIENTDAFVEALYIRELESSTGIGDEIAIPHGISETVKQTAFVYGYHPEGIYYQEGDTLKTKYFFCLAIPADRGGQLELLSELAKKIMQPEFMGQLKEVQNKAEFLAIL